MVEYKVSSKTKLLAEDFSGKEIKRNIITVNQEIVMPTWLIGIIVLIIIVFLALLPLAINIIPEYKRAAHFRLGNFTGIKGPGVVLIIPFVDKLMRKDLRVMDMDVSQQSLITKDNVSTNVDAVVYMRIFDPKKATLEIENHYRATSRLAQTTLRDVLGEVELDDLLSKREELGERIQSIMDKETDPWGVKVKNVTIRNVNLPEDMVRAIASQAEAERNRRARIKKAQGEKEAAKEMREAADLYGKSKGAMRLRELETLVEIATEENLIVVTPSEMGSEVGTVAGLSAALQGKEELSGTEDEE